MNRLSELIVKSGWSIRGLSEASGIPRNTISRLANDKRKARLATLQRLAMFLDGDLRELMFLVDDTAPAHGRKGSAARAVSIATGKRRKKGCAWWLYLELSVAVEHDFAEPLQFPSKLAIAYVIANLRPDIGYISYFGTRAEILARHATFTNAHANDRGAFYHVRSLDNGIILDGSPIKCLIGDAHL